jgi:hypothetical protein
MQISYKSIRLLEDIYQVLKEEKDLNPEDGYKKRKHQNEKEGT